jgi:hypothetical protein
MGRIFFEWSFGGKGEWLMWMSFCSYMNVLELLDDSN